METVKDAATLATPPIVAPRPDGLQPPAPTTPAGWHAPAAGSTRPAVAMTPTEILDQLVAAIASTRGAVLASVDGFSIANSSNLPPEPAHSAMLAAAIGLARQLVGMAGGTNLRQLVVDHDGGLLLVWPIGSKRVLAVIADATVDQRLLRGFVQTNVRLLADKPAGHR